MEKLLLDDLWFIIYSLAYGGLIGLFYDALRMLRILIKPGVVVAFIQDIFFWVFSAVATFTYIFVFAGGTVRLIFMFFVAIGWFLYYISVGKLMVWLWGKAVSPVKALLRKASGFIVKPFNSILENVNTKTTNLKKKFKKIIKNSNFLFHFTKKNNKIYKDKYSYAQRRRR